MICDFNKSWTDVSFGERAALAVVHVSSIPVSMIKGIIELAKLLFFAIACAFTLNKSEIFQTQFKIAMATMLFSITSIGISALGFFAPVNACEWKTNTAASIMKNIVTNVNGNGASLSTLAGLA